MKIGVWNYLYGLANKSCHQAMIILYLEALLNYTVLTLRPASYQLLLNYNSCNKNSHILHTFNTLLAVNLLLLHHGLL